MQNPTSDIDPQRPATAWEWVFRMRQEPLSEEELAAWLNWYESDEKNKDAYDQARSFWLQSGGVAQAVYAAAPAALRPHAPLRQSRSRRRRRLAWLSAACVASVCAALLLPREHLPLSGPLSGPGSEPTAQTTHTTHAAAATRGSGAAPESVSEMTLPDGSKVELAAKSSISLQYTQQARTLVMQRGVAYFSVAHNRERPFIVKVGKICVRAVGTAFNIRSADGRVVVTVAEGTVDVYPASQGAAQEARAIAGDSAAAVGAVRINAGKEVTWAEKTGTENTGAEQMSGSTISAVDPQHALAWREGRLDYMNEPLASAIADINRYSQRQVVIRDEAVGRIMFNGTVLTSATEDWIQALPNLFPVKVYTNQSGDLVLAARAPS